MVLSVASVQLYGAFADEPFRPPLEDLDRPFGEPPLVIDVLGGLFFVMLPLFVACAVSLVLRFRRADPVQRQQIKWLALTGIGLPLYPLLCLIEILVWGESMWVSSVVGIASLVGTPIAAGIAVLRHDLYDVDKALAFTVTWGVLTALLLGAYAVTSTVVGLAVGRDTEAGAAIGTAVAALLLLPALRGVRRVVDARMYPLRRARTGRGRRPAPRGQRRPGPARAAGGHPAGGAAGPRAPARLPGARVGLLPGRGGRPGPGRRRRTRPPRRDADRCPGARHGPGVAGAAA